MGVCTCELSFSPSLYRMHHYDTTVSRMSSLPLITAGTDKAPVCIYVRYLLPSPSESGLTWEVIRQYGVPTHGRQAPVHDCECHKSTCKLHISSHEHVVYNFAILWWHQTVLVHVCVLTIVSSQSTRRSGAEAQSLVYARSHTSPAQHIIKEQDVANFLCWTNHDKVAAFP